MLTLLAQTAPQVAQSSGSGPILFAVVFIGMAVLLFVAELFIPSGGFIGIVASVLLILGIVCLFRVDTTLGLVGATASLIALPIGFAFALKIWPNTPIGRMLILGDDEETDTAGDDTSELDPNALTVGQTGEAMTDLHPIGACRFDGKKQECLAVGGMIEAGETVRVTSVDGMQVKVARVTP